jgi:Protein of unknown function (DUF664)
MPSAVPREDPSLQTDELTSLSAWLDYHRATLLQKCQGLDGSQLVAPSVPTSALTLLGLVRHMLLVEWWWFEHIFAGGESPEPIDTSVDPDADFNDLDPATADRDLEGFARQCDHSRAVVAAAASLEILSASAEKLPRNLRWTMLHMLEEYARHNGHADFLREAIDGVVGE